MPLFAILSGYLFCWSMKKPVKQVMKKRLTSLLLPIFFLVTLECAGRAEIMVIKHEFVFSDFVSFYENKLLNSLWFLWAIFWCSLIVLLVEKIFKGKTWLYILLLIPMLFTPEKFNLHLYAFMYPYFVAGFMFNKFDGGNRYRKVAKKNWVALALTTMVFSALFVCYDYDSYIYTTKINLLGENGVITQLGIDVYRWLIGFAGVITVIILCKIICGRWKGTAVKLFAYFGQISLGIYILNSYVNSYVLRRLTGNFSPNVIIWIAETILSMVVYVIAVEIIKRIPMANRMLLGGR